jgi:uncharacterized membrane protein
METNNESKTKVAYHFFSNTRAIVEEVGGVLGDFKFFFAGIALAVGGILLLLGGVTTGLIVLFISAGYELVVSILFGFLAVGVIGTALGLLVAKHMLDKLKRVYKKYEEQHLHKKDSKQMVMEVEKNEEGDIQNLRILD